jgi:hypothetical protein
MLRFLLRRHPVPTTLLGIALASLLWFATGFVREALYFSDPAHQQQDLALWMSPRYVGKSWDLPPEVIVRTMGLDPDHAQPTLREVTAHLGISLEELQARIEAAKADEDARRAAQHGEDQHGQGDQHD